MKKDSVSLFEVGDTSATLTLDGTEYTIYQLRTGDTAKAQAYVRDQRLQLFVNKSRQGIPMSEEKCAMTMAYICCKPIPILDMLADQDGLGFMLSLAMRTSLRQVAEIPSISQRLLGDVMAYISHLTDPDAAEKPDADPTHPSDGTNTCPPSATTTS